MSSKLLKRNLTLITLIMLTTGCTTKINKHYVDSTAKAKDILVQSSRNNTLLYKKDIENFTSLPVNIKNVLSNIANVDNDRYFNIHANQVPLEQFVQIISKKTGSNFVLKHEKNLDNLLVSLNLTQVNIKDILDVLHNKYNLITTENSSIYYIERKKPKTQFFNVNYLNIYRSGSGSVNVQASQLSDNNSQSTRKNNNNNNENTGGKITSRFTSDNQKFWSDIKRIISFIIDDSNVHRKKEHQEVILGQEVDKNNPKKDKSITFKKPHNVSIQEDIGVIAVTAQPEQLETVGKFLTLLKQHLQRQVIIQAKIIEITLSEHINLGASFKSKGLDVNLTNGRVSYTSGQNTLPNIDLIVDMLSQFGNVAVLSEPVISTLNNQKAIIKVGSDQYYSTGQSSTITPDSQNNIISNNIELTPYFSGLSLDVTPQISDKGYIIMNIHPIISRVKSRTVTVKLSDEQVLEFPTAESLIREADTILRVRNGEVIMLGGLMQSDVDLIRNALPGLSPDTAYRRSGSALKTDLIILLKPTIVENGSWNQTINDFLQNLSHEKLNLNKKSTIDDDIIKNDEQK